MLEIFWGNAPFVPPAYAYVVKQYLQPF